jgi:GNAT superfamily N-acetyltransferase
VTLPGDLRARPARASDGAAIGELMRACDETYVAWAPRGWTPPPVADPRTMRVQSLAQWARVAVDGEGHAIGLVTFRAARSSDEPGGPAGQLVPGVAHVGALYVHPARWREGIARALLACAEAAMAVDGYRLAQLWTPVGAPAERFYRACGWAADGRRGLNPWLGLEVLGYAKSLPQPGDVQ